MEMLWTVVWFLFSWLIWLAWKVFGTLFWAIFGLPLLIVAVIAAALMWRVGPTETLRRLKELRYAVFPALRAFGIALISLVSTMTGASVMQRLPERVQRALIGGTVSAPTRVEIREVEKVVYRCGPIARLFNVFTILYGLMQMTMATLIIGVVAALFL